MLPITDGVVTLRAMRADDTAMLIGGRDDEFHRFMGAGSPDPRPTAIIEVDGGVVGWVDHDHEDLRTWLEPHECNVGYHVFAAHRGRGIAKRAVRLLLGLVAREGIYDVATFLIDAENEPSLHVARAVGAVDCDRLSTADVSLTGRPQVFLVVGVTS